MLSIAWRVVLAVALWIIVSVAVALPEEVLSVKFETVPNAFFTKSHFVFFALLVLLDLGIAILLMKDVNLQRRLFKVSDYSFSL